MISKKTLVFACALAGIGSVAATSASAGMLEREGNCDGDCYVKVHTPPVYGEIHTQVMVKPVVAIRHHVPASYAMVQERVLVSGPKVVWTRKRDAHGGEVMCRVIVPARYETVSRQVMTSPAHHGYEIRSAKYVTHSHVLKLRDGGSAWVPVGEHRRHWED